LTKTLRNLFCFQSAALLASLALLLQPLQAEDPISTLSVDVKVVTVPATVRDKHGEIVGNLTKDDFTLTEDGRPQTIKYFSRDSNLPLTLGLLVDTSISQRNVLDEERNASRSFFDQMLEQDKDRGFIIHFDREVELLQDLTSSREKLQRALDELKTPQPEREQSGDSGDSRGGQGRMHRGGTQLYDAVYLASNELMKKQQGRKALIILSDGVDRGSKTSLESAIESAQRADTMVYSILFKDNHEAEREGERSRRVGVGGGWPGGGGGGWPGGGGGGWPGGGGGRGGRGGGQRWPEEARVDGKKILERISKETGGRMFEISKKETVAQIYSTIADELRTQYNLGYTPDRKDEAEGYHKITLTAKGKDYSVQARDGYYAER
jgi:VWFA-related protein